MSAARTLGGWLPVDMIASIPANACSCRSRDGVWPMISRKAGASFEYVVLATLISVAVSSAASPTGTKLAATYSSIASSVQALT